MTETKRWAAVYLDGETPKRHPVKVAIAATGLRIARQDGTTFWWEYGEIKQTQGRERGEPVRLERGDVLTEALIINEPGFLEAIRLLAPDARLKGPVKRSVGVVLAAGAAVGTVLVAAGLYLWGIPGLATVAASTVPVAWEEALGKSVVARMVPAEKRCPDEASQEAVERIVASLVSGRKTPYTYRVTISNDDMVNAFAAPGGYIVVCKGLLEKTKRPEEIAGVLAHEIQHVEQRHSTKAIFRELSFTVLLGALVGDAGAAKSILEAAGSLGSLGYQRHDEEEADREGMKLMLGARLDPGGMVAAFETLQKEAGDLPKGLEYLSSHPNTGDRIRALKGLAAEAGYQAEPLDVGVSWERVAKACR